MNELPRHDIHLVVGPRHSKPGWHGIAVGLLALLALVLVVRPGVEASRRRLASLIAVIQPDPLFSAWSLGGTASVSIAASGVVNLYAVQLEVHFDPARVQVVDADETLPGVQVSPGTILSGPGWYVLQNSADNATGTIVVLASLTGEDRWFDGAGTLISISFLGIGSGTSALELREVIFSDHNGGNLDLVHTNGTLFVTNGVTLTPTTTRTPTRTPTITPTPIATPSPTPGGPARVIISPAHRDVAIGMTTTVDILILNAYNLYGAEAHLTFDPTIVSVVDMEPATTDVQITLGSFPYADYAPVNRADNISGTLDVALTQIPPRPSVNGSGLYATITFLALRGGISPVHFTSAMLSDPEGIEIPSVTTDGEVDVSQWGNIVGRVAYQGRSIPPGVDWVSPLSVTLTIPGQTIPAYIFSPTTDQTGRFVVGNVITGTFDMRVRDLHSLWNVRRGVHVDMAGTQVVDMGTLVEGDCDLNGVINILDFSMLATAFGTANGQPLYNPRTDLNNTNTINILDFSLLATNYGRSGEIVLTSPGP